MQPLPHTLDHTTVAPFMPANRFSAKAPFPVFSLALYPPAWPCPAVCPSYSSEPGSLGQSLAGKQVMAGGEQPCSSVARQAPPLLEAPSPAAGLA